MLITEGFVRDPGALDTYEDEVRRNRWPKRWND